MGFFHFLNNALNYMKLSTSLLSCDTLVTLGELVWLVFFAKLATISGEGTAVAVSALSHAVSLWLADRNNFLSLCCLSVGAPNLAASGLSRMKCPIKRYDAGQVGTPVSNHMLARLHFHWCSSQVCFDSNIERLYVFCLCLHLSI